MPTLTLTFKNKCLAEYQFQKGTSLTIGRRKTNDVVIEDPAVSGHHAKIDSLGERFVLIDLQSKNGSFVNEQLIHSHWLKHEDVIAIGGHVLVFNYPENEQTRPPDRVNDQPVKKATLFNDCDIIEIRSTRLQFSIENRQDKET